MAIGDQILKSWLRQKYTDNNTLKDTYQSGITLTIPDQSNSLADNVDINTLVASLRLMQDNTYLRYSPLWSSVNINDVTESTLITESKKTDIDNLMTDLLGMCANNSISPYEYNYRANTPTAFGGNNSFFVSFSNNPANATSFDRTCFYWGSNYGSNKSGNRTRFTFNNFAEFATAFSRGGGSFSHNGNVTEFGAHNALSFTQRFTLSFIVQSDGGIVNHSNFAL